MKRDYAIVIGIKRYPELNPLEGAQDDALEFKKWLLESGGVPKENIETIVSEPPKEPKDRPFQKEIDDAFKRLLKEGRKHKARRLYVYFAGHGCSSDADHLALLMADASLEDLNCSLNTESYHQWLVREAVFPELVIFYDCCRNYENAVKGRRAPGSEADPKPGAANVNRFVLYGAAFTQYGHERKFAPPSRKRGLFTTVLLEGLKAGVPVDGRYAVTTASLRKYVTEKLPELARSKFKLSQEPVAGSGLKADFEIVSIAPKAIKPHLVKVTVKGLAAGTQVVIKDGKFAEVAKGAVVNGGAKFQLPPGEYIVLSEDQTKGARLDVEGGDPITIEL